MLPLILIMPVLVILSCASWEWTASAADSVEQQRRETLRGLTGVGVWVGVPSEMMSDGLSDTQIRTEVEVRLRRAGVRVLEVPSRDSATLAITVGGLKSRELGHYAVSVHVELVQGIQVLHNDVRTIGATWSADGFTGLLDGDKLRMIRNTVAHEVDEFVIAYLAVNPK